MKRIVITLVGVAAFILFISAAASGAELGYTDPSGDVENDGMEAGFLPDIDIEKLEVVEGDSQVIVRMTVSGNINLNPESGIFYHYYVYFDHDGDDDADTAIELDTLSAFTYYSDYDTELFRYVDDSMIQGNGTHTLTVTIPGEWLGSAPSIVDVYGTTEVGDLMDYADDWINEDFEGGTPISGGSGDDDTGDDDTGDDDTGDDDTGDDDTGNTTGGGDDGKSDSPGFEIALIIPAIMVLVVLAGIWKRKRN